MKKPSGYLGYSSLLWSLLVNFQKTCYVPGDTDLHGQAVLGKKKRQYHHIYNLYVWNNYFLMFMLATAVFFPFFVLWGGKLMKISLNSDDWPAYSDPP